MSLLCDETKRDIEYGQTLRAGTHSDAIFFSALGPIVIDKIPASVRRKHPCNPKQGGVDIHEAFSGQNFNGSYTLCDFRLGKFLFSLSQKNAVKYLPNHMKMYVKENLRKKT
jgi:hypothetical protein